MKPPTPEQCSRRQKIWARLRGPVYLGMFDEINGLCDHYLFRCPCRKYHVEIPRGMAWDPNKRGVRLDCPNSRFSVRL